MIKMIAALLIVLGFLTLLGLVFWFAVSVVYQSGIKESTEFPDMQRFSVVAKAAGLMVLVGVNMGIVGLFLL